METQIDHNAYSALFSDSEESESGELSALLANPDLDTQKALSIRELQEPSEAGGEKRSRTDQPHLGAAEANNRTQTTFRDLGFFPPDKG